MPIDTSFSDQFLKGVQQAREEQQAQRDAELHKLIVQKTKLELDTAKLQQALHQQAIQGMSSGGPMTQPAVSGSDTIAPPQIAPEVPQNIADLITQIRSKPVQPIGQQQMPINPLPGPNIPVQLSTGMMTIPGNNLEMQREADQRAAQAAINTKLAGEVHAGSEHGLYTGAGRQIAPPTPKVEELTTLQKDTKAVTPNWDLLSPADKLKAMSAFKKATDVSPDSPDLQAMADYLKRNPGKGPLDYENYKAGRAQAIANANIQGAVKNVAPHLVAAATASYEKASNDYASAVQAHDNMQSVLDEAKAGNKVAYSYVPVEGAIYMQTSQGIKRMNIAEAMAFGGGGSALQRIQAFVGKQATGESIPPEILKDMGTVTANIGANARKGYENKIKVTNAGFGSTFQPIEFGGAVAPEGQVGTVTIVKPDGTRGTIPRANLAAAIKLGAKEVK